MGLLATCSGEFVAASWHMPAKIHCGVHSYHSTPPAAAASGPKPAGLRAAMALQGAVGHGARPLRSSTRCRYQCSFESTQVQVGRLGTGLLQLSQQPGSGDCIQQQQTLWSPQEHHALLQLQIEPALKVQKELLRAQQQEQQAEHTLHCTTSSAQHVDPAGSDGVARSVLVTAFAAATDKYAGSTDSASVSIDSGTSCDTDSIPSTGLRERMRQRRASQANQAGKQATPAALRPRPPTGNSNGNGGNKVKSQQPLDSPAAGSSDSGPSTGTGDNDGNIAAVLQQLQQKLGQQFSPLHHREQATANASKAGKEYLQQPRQELPPHSSRRPSLQSESSWALPKKAARSTPLRKVPQSAVVILKEGQEYVFFSAGKLRAMFPGRNCGGKALRPVQEETATPLADLQRVLDSVGAPETVRLRLLHDWRSNLRMPSDVHLFEQQLWPFSQMAALLGGPDSAAEILSTDSTYMIMRLERLQEMLSLLQQLVIKGSVVAAGASVDSLSPGPTRATAAAAAASVLGGSSSIAAIKQRLASRQKQQKECAILPVAVLQTPRMATSSSNMLDFSDSKCSSGDSSTERRHHSSIAATRVDTRVFDIVRCQPGILWLSPGELQDKLKTVQQALQFDSVQQVLQLLRVIPHLLEASACDLRTKVTALADGLQVPPAQAATLIYKQPLLLNLSSGSLKQRIIDLRNILGYSPKIFMHLVLAKPGVLFFTPEKIRAKLIRLQYIAGTYNIWASELKTRLSPGSLVQLLTTGDRRLLRAEYLVSLNAQHQQGMLYTVQVQSDKAFNKKFSGFERWYTERQQQGQLQRG